MIVADFAEDSGGKVHIVGAGITRLTPPSLPARLPVLSVFIRLVVGADDHGRDHDIAIRFEDPDGEPIGSLSNYPVAADALERILASSLEGEIAAVQVISTQIAPTFPKAGAYHVIVEVDRAEAARYPLIVVAPD